MNSKDNHGDTPLHIAALRGDPDSLLKLMESSADSTLLNENKETAQDIALEYGHKNCEAFIASFRLLQIEKTLIASDTLPSDSLPQKRRL